MVPDPRTVVLTDVPDLAHARDRLTWYATIARLAPSKHNAQPWRLVLRPQALEVWPELTRALPVTDPRGRELVLGCGACVQTAVVAATALGVRLHVAAWPDGPDGPVARLTEQARTTPTEHDRALLAAVSRRRTDRGPLDATGLPASLPFALTDVAAAHRCLLRLVRSEGDQRTLARVIDLADRQLAQLPEVEQEIAQWVRLPHQPTVDGVPAQASRGPHASYAAPFVQRDFSVGDVMPVHDRSGVDAPLVAVLSTHGDTPEYWLQGGRALMAVLLEVTVAGGNASYLNQPLELPRTRDLLKTDLDLVGHPQVVLRIGVGGSVDAPPRRPVEDVLVRPDA